MERTSKNKNKKAIFGGILLVIIICIAEVVSFLKIHADENTNNAFAAEQTSQPLLTLTDLNRLVEGGIDLSWEDFEGYAWTTSTSGLRTQEYMIDKRFWVLLGSINWNPKDSPNITLHVNDGTGDTIDVRTENIERFVERHKETVLLQGAYRMVAQKQNQVHRPWIFLYEDNTFSLLSTDLAEQRSEYDWDTPLANSGFLDLYFAFQMVNWTGTYQWEDSRLILVTYDKKHTFVFDVVLEQEEDDPYSIRFDAASSSDTLWSDDIEDGMEFWKSGCTRIQSDPLASVKANLLLLNKRMSKLVAWLP